MKGQGVVWALMVVGCVAFWLTAALFIAQSCSTPPKGSPGRLPLGSPLDATRRVSVEQALILPVITTAALPTEGRYIEHHGSTACQAKSGINPYLWVPRNAVPRVGDTVEVVFTTRACEPYPAEDAFVVFGFTKLDHEIDFTPFGMPGCQLLIQPDSLVFVPSSGLTGIISRSKGSGRITFSWVPPAGSAGLRLFMQLLVAAPGETTSGFLSSHAVEVRVGS